MREQPQDSLSKLCLRITHRIPRQRRSTFAGHFSGKFEQSQKSVTRLSSATLLAREPGINARVEIKRARIDGGEKRDERFREPRRTRASTPFDARNDAVPRGATHLSLRPEEGDGVEDWRAGWRVGTFRHDILAPCQIG